MADETNSPRKSGPAPQKLTPERFSHYLSYLEKVGSHVLASQTEHVRLCPDYVAAEIASNVAMAKLAKLALAKYSARLVAGLEHAAASGIALTEGQMAVLLAHGGPRYTTRAGALRGAVDGSQ